MKQRSRNFVTRLILDTLGDRHLPAIDLAYLYHQGRQSGETPEPGSDISWVRVMLHKLKSRGLVTRVSAHVADATGRRRMRGVWSLTPAGQEMRATWNEATKETT